MTSARDVAALILSTAKQHDELVSPLKLQKLLYFVQGSYVAEFDSPLFFEDLRAWQHGPVVREVWNDYSEFGSSAITEIKSGDPLRVHQSARRVIADVWRGFGQYSAWRLRELSHETTPWKQAASNAIITVEAMRAYFRVGMRGLSGGAGQ